MPGLYKYSSAVVCISRKYRFTARDDTLSVFQKVIDKNKVLDLIASNPPKDWTDRPASKQVPVDRTLHSAHCTPSRCRAMVTRRRTNGRTTVPRRPGCTKDWDYLSWRTVTRWGPNSMLAESTKWIQFRRKVPAIPAHFAGCYISAWWRRWYWRLSKVSIFQNDRLEDGSTTYDLSDKYDTIILKI